MEFNIIEWKEVLRSGLGQIKAAITNNLSLHHYRAGGTSQALHHSPLVPWAKCRKKKKASWEAKHHAVHGWWQPHQKLGVHGQTSFCIGYKMLLILSRKKTKKLFNNIWTPTHWVEHDYFCHIRRMLASSKLTTIFKLYNTDKRATVFLNNLNRFVYEYELSALMNGNITCFSHLVILLQNNLETLVDIWSHLLSGDQLNWLCFILPSRKSFLC